MKDRSFNIKMVYHFVKDYLLLLLSGDIGKKESKQWGRKLEIQFNVFRPNSEATASGAGEQYELEHLAANISLLQVLLEEDFLTCCGVE